MSARASRTENQDAIDAAIVGMLADPKEVCFLFICPVMQHNGWNVDLNHTCEIGACWDSRSALPSF